MGRLREIAAFRLQIGGRVIYAEGEFAGGAGWTEDLPLPAADTPADLRNLPVVEDSDSCDTR